MKRGLKLGFGITLCVLGFFTSIFAVAILALVGPDGRFTLETDAATETRALVFDAISLREDLPRSGRLAATLSLEVSSDRTTFLGVGPTPEVARYLRGVEVAHVVQVNWPGGVRTEDVTGARTPTPPADATFWVASDQGSDPSIEWTVRGGDWTIVVMNADGSQGVAADVGIGAEFDWLIWIAIVLLVVGAVTLLVGALCLFLVIRRGDAEPADAGAA
ncbi:MAG TPA: hypothetical protein VIB62_04800, partial [Actinomycetota bacterium]